MCWKNFIAAPLSGSTTQLRHVLQSSPQVNSNMIHETHKRPTIIKFRKHIYLPIKCNVKIKMIDPVLGIWLLSAICCLLFPASRVPMS